MNMLVKGENVSFGKDPLILVNLLLVISNIENVTCPGLSAAKFTEH